MPDIEQQQTIGMALANRAYAYSAFHMAFGEEPSEETLQLLYGAQLRDILAQAGIALDDACSGQDVQALAEEMKSDFTKLFDVPGPTYVHSWESPYIGKESMLFQESTLDVRNYYHAAGLKLQAERHFPDDHIAAMMDFMGTDAAAAYEAYADGDDAKVAKMLQLQNDFAEKHILNWIDKFVAKVQEQDAHGYYAAYAQAMAAYVKADHDELATIRASL